MRLFGTSGIRLLANSELLDISLKVGLCLGRSYKRVIVGSDTRTSSPSVKSVLLAGLMAAGAKPWDSGILPTPTLARAAKTYDCAVMVTASHNPPEYNGLKMLNPDGSPFDTAQQRQVEECVANGLAPAAGWESFQYPECTKTPMDEHIAHIRERFGASHDISVVVDCGGGAASVITPRMLEVLGCRVHAINATPTGYFPRPSEPVEENLTALKQAVMEFGADLGLAHDGDADRVMAVDERGRFVSGDALLSIFAKGLGAKKIVTTVDASMTIDDLGIQVERTGVGDNNVSEALRSGGDFGGEPSGAWIFPGSSLCPDGIYGAAVLVDLVSKSKLSVLAATIKQYPIRRGSVKGIIDLGKFESALLKMLKPLTVQSIGGLKLNLEDGWVLVRVSGTEPKTRLTVEARTPDRANDIFEKVEDLILESSRK